MRMGGIARLDELDKKPVNQFRLFGQGAKTGSSLAFRILTKTRLDEGTTRNMRYSNIVLVGVIIFSY